MQESAPRRLQPPGALADWIGVDVSHDTPRPERWLPLPGHKGYEVSDHGRVRSFKAWRKFSAGTPRIVNGGVGANGYRWVSLYEDGRQRSYMVHRLVLLAFAGPSDLEIRHLDGDRFNNSLENLRYGSSSENKRDTVRHGRHNNARKTHCPKGHPYVGVNLIYDGRHRTCRTCRTEQDRRRRE